MAQAAREGKLVIPIGMKFPLQDAAKGHAAVAKRAVPVKFHWL
jgi:hypothetical protein